MKRRFEELLRHPNPETDAQHAWNWALRNRLDLIRAYNRSRRTFYAVNGYGAREWEKGISPGSRAQAVKREIIEAWTAAREDSS
jgi:hypothetical protein